MALFALGSVASARQPSNPDRSQENSNAAVSAGMTGGGMGSGAMPYGGSWGDEVDGDPDVLVMTGGNTPRVPGEGAGEGSSVLMGEWNTGLPAGDGGEEDASAAVVDGPDGPPGGGGAAVTCVNTCNLIFFLALRSGSQDAHPYAACVSTCAGGGEAEQ